MSESAISTAELTRPARHLFLSPHYDDIALSCGGTATLLSRNGRVPEVALIFGAEPDPAAPLTDFAQFMHEGWGMDAATVIAGRRREEAAAASIIGTKDFFLPFLDAIYRGDRYTSDPMLFGQVVPDEADLGRKIVEALDLAERPLAEFRLYAPLALGNHVDHQHAFNAGVDLTRSGGEVWFYEDLPYALKPGVRDARFASCGVRFEVAAIVDVEAAWVAKIEAILAYPSQLATIFRYVDSGSSRAEIEELTNRYARELGGGTPAERYWRLASGRR